MYSNLDCDSTADFTYILGDMNYRINSTFSLLTKNIELSRAEEMDQLYLSFRKGNYPGYKEPKKNFLPTYKLDKKKKEVYVNKKE